MRALLRHGVLACLRKSSLPEVDVPGTMNGSLVFSWKGIFILSCLFLNVWFKDCVTLNQSVNLLKLESVTFAFSDILQFFKEHLYLC